MTKICLYRMSLNRIQQLSVCCHGYTFTIVTNKRTTSVLFIVSILEVGSRHQNEACGNRWTWKKIDDKFGNLHQILCQNTNS